MRLKIRNKYFSVRTKVVFCISLFNGNDSSSAFRCPQNKLGYRDFYISVFHSVNEKSSSELFTFNSQFWQYRSLFFIEIWPTVRHPYVLASTTACLYDKWPRSKPFEMTEIKPTTNVLPQIQPTAGHLRNYCDCSLPEITALHKSNYNFTLWNWNILQQLN